MIDKVLLQTYPAPPVDKREILRYSGCRGENEEVENLLDEVIALSEGAFSYKVCYREFPVVDGETLDLGFLQTRSQGLKKNLSGCKSVIAFGATVGIGVDRLIARYSGLSPSKALLLQAYGAERVEALCDAFQEDLRAKMREKGLFLRPRFSPGYGDFPLEAQSAFVSVLDCGRKIGVALNDSLLMSPSKSVTALIGLSDSPCRERSGCSYCNQRDCEFRKG